MEEVRRLKLVNQPSVLLLSCEGTQPGSQSETTASFADALKAAGAAAVYGSTEKLDVRDALSIADRYKEQRGQGLSPLDGIRNIDQQQRKFKAPRMRLKVNYRFYSSQAATAAI